MPDALFDPAFYRQHHGLDDSATFTHFLAKGDRMGLDPSPYFSTRFYKNAYLDWQSQGAPTAFHDFLNHVRAGRMRQPHPLIDPACYLARYPDLAPLGAQAAVHFMTHGDHEVRAPSAAFDAGFYQRCYLALEERRPFRHFVMQGQALGNLARPIPRSAGDSRARMAQSLNRADRPILLCAHDAQQAGVPLLALDLAAALADRGWQPIFVLHRAGPLHARFAALGPVHVLAEGWDLLGLIEALPSGLPAIVNTGVAADIAQALAAAGQPSVLLIHEMADHLREAGVMADLLAAWAQGARLVASVPRTAAALESHLGPMPVLLPGVALPPAPLAAFRRARQWRSAQAGPVFIGAGHADHRKGFDLFLQAAAEIRRQRPDARFVWLGALSAWARDLADAALAEGLDLTLPGFVPDTLAWYRAADAYLLTSRQDPGPTTVIHAAAVGTPFVGYGTDIGIMDLAGAIGLFHTPGDLAGFVTSAQALAAAVTPASRRTMRRAVRAETGLAPYLDAILKELTLAATDVAI